MTLSNAKGNTFEDGILSLVFTNAALANVGDASGLQPSSAAGNISASLHTADPGETGSQTTSEAAYTNYARQSIARSTSGWTVSSGVCTNDNDITWPQAGASGGATMTHVGLGGQSNLILYRADMTPTIAVANGIQPKVPAGQLSVAEE